MKNKGGSGILGDNINEKYQSHISQPLLDRMDICVEAPKISYEELTAEGENESSEVIRRRVARCHRRQYERYRDEPFLHNCQIPAGRLSRFCPLGEKEEHYMGHMYGKLGLTARSYHKILRVARTIADLDGSERIRMKHLNEAVCYRSVGESFWGGMEG